jgi:hypothetical protein
VDPNELKEARAAYARRDLVAARDAYVAAQAVGSLTAEDLSALGDAAWWIGDVATLLSAEVASGGGVEAAGYDLIVDAERVSGRSRSIRYTRWRRPL